MLIGFEGLLKLHDGGKTVWPPSIEEAREAHGKFDYPRVAFDFYRLRDFTSFCPIMVDPPEGQDHLRSRDAPMCGRFPQANDEEFIEEHEVSTAIFRLQRTMISVPMTMSKSIARTRSVSQPAPIISEGTVDVRFCRQSRGEFRVGRC